MIPETLEVIPRMRAAADPIRVAVVCDFPEEGWPSMDLVGAMLVENLGRDRAERVAASRVCPPFKHRFSRIRKSGGARIASNTDRLLNRFWFYPGYIGRLSGQFDVFHIADHSYSQLIHQLPAERTVVTCHDLDTFRCLLEPEREPRSFLFRAMTQRILAGFRRAAKIACDSRWTRDEILSYRLVPAERLEVVPAGVGPVFTPKADLAADAEVERMLGGPDRRTVYLLHVGSTIRRKRIDVLLRTFARVHKELPATQLLRVGGPFDEPQLDLVRSLKLRDSVTVLPFLTAEVLAAVYRRATLLLLTSEAEGFGFPMIEAMACGTPAVVSDLPVLRETGGTAAEYCPVADVEAWSSKVAVLLKQREGWRSRRSALRQMGLAQASHFSWTVHAERMIGIYTGLIP